MRAPRRHAGGLAFLLDGDCKARPARHIHHDSLIGLVAEGRTRTADLLWQSRSMQKGEARFQGIVGRTAK
jgi:hypothetical protein